MTHANYALVTNGKVMNIVVIDDQDAPTLARFAAQHEAVVPLVVGEHGIGFTERSGRIGGPGIGWSYNANAKRFTAPPLPPEVPAAPPGP